MMVMSLLEMGKYNESQFFIMPFQKVYTFAQVTTATIINNVKTWPT